METEGAENTPASSEANDVTAASEPKDLESEIPAASESTESNTEADKTDWFGFYQLTG